MARGDFRLRLHAPGDRIRVGDEVTAEVTVTTPKTHKDATLEWEAYWCATGETNDSTAVISGTAVLGRLEAHEQTTHEFTFRIPEAGPITYDGQLFRVRWYLRASLDIPWAFDPKETFELRVHPRQRKRKRRRAR